MFYSNQFEVAVKRSDFALTHAQINQSYHLAMRITQQRSDLNPYGEQRVQCRPVGNWPPGINVPPRAALMLFDRFQRVIRWNGQNSKNKEKM